MTSCPSWPLSLTGSGPGCSTGRRNGSRVSRGHPTPALPARPTTTRPCSTSRDRRCRRSACTAIRFRSACTRTLIQPPASSGPDSRQAASPCRPSTACTATLTCEVTPGELRRGTVREQRAIPPTGYSPPREGRLAGHGDERAARVVPLVDDAQVGRRGGGQDRGRTQVSPREDRAAAAIGVLKPSGYPFVDVAGFRHART